MYTNSDEINRSGIKSDQKRAMATIKEQKTVKGAKHLVTAKMSKPLMEKRRRVRINESLTQMRMLMYDHTKDFNRVQKVEKADILQNTVKFIKRNGTCDGMSPTDFAVQGSSAGFLDCMASVLDQLDSSGFESMEVREHLVNFLASKFFSSQIEETPHSLQTHTAARKKLHSRVDVSAEEELLKKVGNCEHLIEKQINIMASGKALVGMYFPISTLIQLPNANSSFAGIPEDNLLQGTLLQLRYTSPADWNRLM